MRSFILYLSVIFCFLTGKSFAQIENTWVGVLEVAGMQFDIILHVTKTDNGIQTKMDIPKQGATGLKADESTYVDGAYTAAWSTPGIRIEGKINEEGQLETTFIQGPYNIPIVFKAEKEFSKLPRMERLQDPKPEFNYQIEEVEFYNSKDSVKLAGTFTSPHGVSQPPVVILVSGSGQQNRDEELFGHKPFWVIADYFANQGIAVLRYDDRGVGGSDAGKDLTKATTLDFARDAEAALDYLKKRGYKHIGILGHSEGALIGAIIAAKRKDVDFLISMAGPGVPGDELLAMQTYKANIAMGVDEEVAQLNGRVTANIAKFAKEYKGDNLTQAMTTRLKLLIEDDSLTSVLPDEQKEQIISSSVQMMSTPWMVQFVKLDPAEYLKKVKCPVLVLNGSLDVQVPADENIAAIQQALMKAKNKNVTVHKIEGLNHLMQPATTGAPAEYAQIEITIERSVMEMMAEWIKGLQLK